MDAWTWLRISLTLCAFVCMDMCMCMSKKWGRQVKIFIRKKNEIQSNLPLEVQGAVVAVTAIRRLCTEIDWSSILKGVISEENSVVKLTNFILCYVWTLASARLSQIILDAMLGGIVSPWITLNISCVCVCWGLRGCLRVTHDNKYHLP